MSDETPSVGRSSAVMLVGQMLNLTVSFTSLVLLSRLLPPSDFGLVAMVGVFMAAGSLFTDMGLSTAALRARSLTRAQASNMFWVNAGLSLTATVVLAACSPLIASIYGDPRLTPITLVLSLGLLASGLQAQFQVQLARNGRFAPLALVGAVSSGLGLVVAVGGIYLGWGYWALVAQSLVTSYSALVFKVVASRWRPGWFTRGEGTRTLLISGLDFSGAGALHQVSANADTFMIGLRWNATDVGVFSRARQIADLPITLLTPLMNVMVPSLNRVVAAGKNAEAHLLRLQSTLGTIGSLLLVVIAASAPDLFVLVLGPDWAMSAELFRILAIGTAARVLTQVSYWAFITLGSSRQWLRYNVVSKSLAVLLIVGGAFISLPAVAAAHALGNVLAWLLNVAWLQKTAALEARPFYTNGLRILSAALLAVVVTGMVPIAGMFTSVVAVIAAQMGLSLLLFVGSLATTRAGRTDMKDVVRLIRSRKI